MVHDCVEKTQFVAHRSELRRFTFNYRYTYALYPLAVIFKGKMTQFAANYFDFQRNSLRIFDTIRGELR